MYTNATSSTLNFNLYKGGKTKSKVKTKINTRKYKHKGGKGCWFDFSPKKSKITKKWEDDCMAPCMKSAETLCNTTCKNAAYNATKSRSGTTIKSLEDYIKVQEENRALKYKVQELENKLNYRGSSGYSGNGYNSGYNSGGYNSGYNGRDDYNRLQYGRP